MKNRSITLMIVPEATSQVKRLQVRREMVAAALLGVLGCFAVLAVVMIHYAYVVGEVIEARALREERRTLQEENAALRGRLSDFDKKATEIDDRLLALSRFDTQLREMTRLNDTDRGLAMGPVTTQYGAGGGPSIDADPFAVPIAGDDAASRALHEALLDSRLDGLAHEANRQLGSLSQLVEHFTAREQVLASTPSVWPASGWVTSTFGMRDDPYTSERVMHLGVDVSAREGTPVMAPARGTVMHAGQRGAYGNLVALDHGNGIVTHYAHLERMLVKEGDKVSRGQHIGDVGNTGRSTGPHLHYEVRVGGVPVNPKRFILD